VIDPETRTLLGRFAAQGLVLPDGAAGRVYFLTAYGSILKAFDRNTFLPLGTLNIPGIKGTPSSLIRWGSNGLAFRTSGNQVFLIQSALVPSPDPVPATPAPTPTPTPLPLPMTMRVRQISLLTNDIIY